MLPGLRFPTYTAGVLVLVLALAGATDADHPDDPLDHLHVTVKDLGPGETHRVPIESTSHGELKAGWIYIVHGLVEGNESIQVALERDHEPAENTENETWQPGYNTMYTKIAETGPHDLVLHNPGDETIRYGFYYDQSCNCVGKAIPLPEGVVLFNYPLPADTPFQISYSIAFERPVPEWGVKASLATHDNSSTTASWPEDFDILEEKEISSDKRQHWLNFTFQTDAQGTYYVHLEALKGTDPGNPMLMSGIAEPLTSDQAVEQSPAPMLLPLVAGALVLVAARRFKRTG